MGNDTEHHATTHTRVGSKVTNLKTVFGKMTGRLFLIWMITALVNIIFGYETTSFGGLQSIPAFAKEFGNESAKKPGTYALTAARASYTSSSAFGGKLVGSLVAAPIVEKVGHRIAIFLVCLTVWIGVILEATSTQIGQFIAGRIVIYFSVGLAEVTTTGYQSELVPAAMRGTVVGSIQLFNLIGQILAAGINRAYSTTSDKRGWIIPVCFQAAIPIVIFIGTFFIPLSPRWLITKDRKEEAVEVLNKVRPHEDVVSGSTRLEVEAIHEYLLDTTKAPWIDLVKGTNLRRTLIACGLLGLQQFLGQGFVSGYSPRFYKTVGLSEHAFDYNIGSSALGWLGCLLGMLGSDFIGRRPILIWGALLQAVFLFLIAGLGLKSDPTKSDGYVIVAGVFLYFFFYSGTWGPLLFTTCAELGTNELREKTLSIGIALNVVTAFIVSFCVPYILDAIASNIGWVFGGIAICLSVLVFFVLPETKDRSLEELDELFKARVPARRFSKTETYGAGRRITALEHAGPGKLDGDTRIDEMEDTTRSM